MLYIGYYMNNRGLIAELQFAQQCELKEMAATKNVSNNYVKPLSIIVVINTIVA